MAPKLKQSFFSISKKDLLLTGLFNIANMHRQSQINFINLRIAIFQQNNTMQDIENLSFGIILKPSRRYNSKTIIVPVPCPT